MNAVEVEGACLEFKSISFSGMNGADSCSFYRQQLYHSCNSVDALGGGKTMEESDSGAESASHDARSLQSDDEVILYSVVWSEEECIFVLYFKIASIFNQRTNSDLSYIV